jgi:glycerate kinase
VRVLIAPDKFKGSLSARDAAAAIASGWQQVRPGDEVCLLPITDGGDGFGEIVGGLLEAQERTAAACDAAHRPRQGRWAWAETSRTAVVESAESIGLAKLPKGVFHPFELDTRGLGLVLRRVAENGPARCLVGVGGSATNDGGFGLARALGWHFTDRHGADLERWTELYRLDCILRPAQTVALGEVVVAVDVRNPLLGPEGCSRIYGPQKGLGPDDFELAERCLGRLAEVALRERLGVTADTPGTGAAGGLGFGLPAFAGARLEAGFQLFAELAGLRARVQAADLVITGEGSLDASSLMGKGVGELAALCRQEGVLCAGLAGSVKLPPLDSLFCQTLALAPDLASIAEAQSNAGRWLGVAAGQLAARY